MSVDRVLREATAVAEAAAGRAVVDAGERLAARASAIAGVAAQGGDGVVVLRGRGLVARAFGSRRRTADPGFADLVRGERR